MKALWTFIVAVALLDVYFALAFEGYFALWETNPLACFFYEHIGIAGIVAYRLVSLGFAAMVIAQAKPIWARRATLFIAAVHLAMLANYVMVYLYGGIA